jgi:lysophospholipase L1-like esterase
MPKDDLLTETAQNALGSIKSLASTKYKGFMALDDADGTGKMDVDTIFNNFAPPFIPSDKPNPTTTVAGQPYMYNGVLYTAKEAYQGAWDSTKFIEVPMSSLTLSRIANPDTSVAPFNDLNTFPTNSTVIVIYSGLVEKVAHKPTQKAFVCSTFGIADSASTQIVSDGDRTTWIRSKWGTIWSSWVLIKNELRKELNPDTSTAPFNDLDTFPANSVVMITSGGSSIAHKPSVNSFLCYTYSARFYEGSHALTDNGVTQILSDGDRTTWIRSKWGYTWGDWVKIEQTLKLWNPDTSTTPYDNLNTYPINSIILFTNDTALSVQNIPSNRQFSVYTFASTTIVKTQIVSDANKDIYMRSCWGTIWGTWKKMPEPSDNYSNVLTTFSNIVCVGDSLTYSQVYTGDNTSRQAYKPWPTILGTITGATTFNYGYAGDTAASSWNRWKDTFETKANALAIIYLGTNYGLTDTLDTDAPSASPYTEWADTNTGCYAKIIARLQELGYKILLIKPWAVGSGSLSDTKKVISEAAVRFGCSVLDPISNDAAEFHYWPDLQGSNPLHMNDLGYAWFAQELVKNVSALGETLKYIIPN